ncbi:hypothetical protein ACQ4M3_41400 [Leptolyngbya sp. AN03gr2]
MASGSSFGVLNLPSSESTDYLEVERFWWQVLNAIVHLTSLLSGI